MNADLLPIAQTPPGERSVAAWHPFPGGDSLTQIVDDHNAECLRYFDNKGFLPEQIAKLVETVNVLDYGIQSIGNLTADRFKTIRIVVVDLEALEAWRAKIGDGPFQKAIGALRYRMSPGEHIYYLCEIGSSSGAPSCASYFTAMPVLADSFTTEEAFREFLNRFSGAWSKIITQVRDEASAVQAGQTSALGRAAAHFERSLPEIAAMVRDTAMMNRLSDTQTVALTQSATRQGFALSQMSERIRLKGGGPVTVDAIRRPLCQALEGPALYAPLEEQDVELLRVELMAPMRTLTDEQRNFALALGVRKTRNPTIHFNLPETRIAIGRLGGVVRGDSFASPLLAPESAFDTFRSAEFGPKFSKI